MKEKIHHVDEAKDDQATFLKHAAHAAAQIADGHYRIENAKQEDLGDGRVRISFERVETDPSEVAAD